MNTNPVANRVIEKCGSTNDLARTLGEANHPHGTWISARLQEKGRGRLGREWCSMEGNLFLSMVIRLEKTELWSWIPLAAAVGVARSLRKEFQAIDVRIKWPNDLWLEGAKLGGILCESVGGRKGSFILVGLGLNCATAPDDLDQKTASLTGELSSPAGPIHADRVRLKIIESWLHVFGELSQQGSEFIATEYERLAVLRPGVEIEWGSEATSTQGVGGTGTVLGLGERGELCVRLKQGGETHLFAEDVKLRRISASPEATCESPL